MLFAGAPGTFRCFRCQPVEACPRQGSPACRRGVKVKRTLLISAILTVSACSQPIDIGKAIQVDVATSGWRVAGVVDGKNKIVPSVSVTLKNISGQTLNAVQTNAVFRLASTNAEIGTDFRPV